MAAQHTPTPWQVDSGDELAIQSVEGGAQIATVLGPDDFLCRDDDDDEVFEEECEANAAFIVRACNAHDDLVAALKSALAYVDAEAMLKDDDLHVSSVKCMDLRDGVVRQFDCEAARATLAKAGAA
jgi:hypothetical protein